MTQRDFFQPWARGCAWHLVVYNDSTGAMISRTSESGGLGQNTIWSQGQAWAIAGYAIAYEYTRDPSFLEQAVSAAECYVALVNACCGEGTDDHFAPIWDFNATGASQVHAVDLSAGVIAASGLIRLSAFVSSSQRESYLDFANKTLRSSLQYWRFAPDSNVAVLRNGTLTPDFGVALIYSDYYLLEAAVRWNNTRPTGESSKAVK